MVVGFHERQLVTLNGAGGNPHPIRRNRQQQVGHGWIVKPLRDHPLTDELPHHAQATRARDPALVRCDVADDDAQQRRLARSVGADQRNLLPVAHPERDLVEQDPAVRQVVAHAGDVHMAHGSTVRAQCCPRRGGL